MRPSETWLKYVMSFRDAINLIQYESDSQVFAGEIADVHLKKVWRYPMGGISLAHVRINNYRSKGQLVQSSKGITVCAGSAGCRRGREVKWTDLLQQGLQEGVGGFEEDEGGGREDTAVQMGPE